MFGILSMVMMTWVSVLYLCLVDQLCPTLVLEPTRLLCPWGFSRLEYWSGLSWPPPGDLPNPGIKPRSHTLQADSLPSEQPGKPKNAGVCSLSLLHRIFLTRELNRCLLHCRQILYRLNYQEALNIGVYLFQNGSNSTLKMQ